MRTDQPLCVFEMQRRTTVEPRRGGGGACKGKTEGVSAAGREGVAAASAQKKRVRLSKTTKIRPLSFAAAAAAALAALHLKTML